MSRSLSVLALLLAPALSFAYPGGTPDFVTDVAPFCAGCHSSTSPDQLAGVPASRAEDEQVESKHIAKIRAARPDSPYAKLTEQQRAELIAGIQKIDQGSRVEIRAPSSLTTGQEFDVTVKATGGAGPVIGLALVDSGQRFRARPAASAGWHVLAPPKVMGPDGKPQTQFTEKRADGAGISYVNVSGVTADPQAGKLSTVSVTWRLRAPDRAGSYPLAAVFLYGTEKGAPHGAVDAPWGGKQPIGGLTANAGRVRFSDVQQIQVK
jgi:hypothetical protein